MSTTSFIFSLLAMYLLGAITTIAWLWLTGIVRETTNLAARCDSDNGDDPSRLDDGTCSRGEGWLPPEPHPLPNYKTQAEIDEGRRLARSRQRENSPYYPKLQQHKDCNRVGRSPLRDRSQIDHDRAAALDTELYQTQPIPYRVTASE